MIYKQCKFKDFDAINDGGDWIGGIAILEPRPLGETIKERLEGVICGCCGSIIEADEIAEIKCFETWVDIDKAILILDQR